MSNNREARDDLWRALVFDDSTDERTEIGWTFCWATRTAAKEAGMYYMLANHLTHARVSTHRFVGVVEQVGRVTRGSHERPVYRAYDEDASPLPADANCMQYASLLSADFDAFEADA